jgi:hypothetical protein
MTGLGARLNEALFVKTKTILVDPQLIIVSEDGSEDDWKGLDPTRAMEHHMSRTR